MLIVVYSEERWRILREKRERALEIMKILGSSGIEGFAYGSLARGDVDRGSDIDIAVLDCAQMAKIEGVLESMAGSKFVVQATPGSTPKGYIALDPEELEVVSFPLAPLEGSEYEFYRFGGLLDRGGIERGDRVPGVDKRLMLILPRPYGHEELELKGREAEASRLLGISIDTVMERVRVLERRREHGRTGVYVKYHLPPGMSFSEALKLLSKRYRHFGRVMEERGYL